MTDMAARRSEPANEAVTEKLAAATSACRRKPNGSTPPGATTVVRFPGAVHSRVSCEMTVLTGVCGQRPGTRPVGSRSADSASPYGALDMFGNVWEWVSDAWNEGSYSRGDVTDPFVQSPSNQGAKRKH